MTTNRPLELYADKVRPEWIDYNGHMNVAYYVLAFDLATDAFLDFIGLTSDVIAATNSSTFVLDMNVSYKREVVEGDPLKFSTQIIDADEKRIHYVHCMYHGLEGYLAATNEILLAHVDMTSRRIAPMPDKLQHRVVDLYQQHRALNMPDDVGRKIGIRKK